MQKKVKKIKNFRLSLVDDETHKPIFVTRFSRTRFLTASVSAIVLVCLLFFIITAYTPVRTLIPGYPDARAKRAAIQNAIKIDSLEMLVSRWELYSENMKRILSGQEPLRIDSLIMQMAGQDKKTLSEKKIRSSLTVKS